MYDIAVIALVGLAVIELVRMLKEVVPALDRYRDVLTVVLSVGAAVVLDYSVFDRFDVALRDEAIGPWMTGLAIAGVATVWRAVLAWLRKDAIDEAGATSAQRPARIAA